MRHWEGGACWRGGGRQGPAGPQGGRGPTDNGHGPWDPHPPLSLGGGPTRTVSGNDKPHGALKGPTPQRPPGSQRFAQKALRSTQCTPSPWDRDSPAPATRLQPPPPHKTHGAWPSRGGQLLHGSHLGHLRVADLHMSKGSSMRQWHASDGRRPRAPSHPPTSSFQPLSERLRAPFPPPSSFQPLSERPRPLRPPGRTILKEERKPTRSIRDVGSESPTDGPEGRPLRTARCRHTVRSLGQGYWKRGGGKGDLVGPPSSDGQPV